MRIGRVVDLLHLGGVLRREAVGVDKEAEDIVAGPGMPADAPFDRIAAHLQSARRAHEPVEVRQLERHVVEPQPSETSERHAVMVARAAQEIDAVGPVGNLETEQIAEESSRSG